MPIKPITNINASTFNDFNIIRLLRMLMNEIENLEKGTSSSYDCNDVSFKIFKNNIKSLCKHPVKTRERITKIISEMWNKWSCELRKSDNGLENHATFERPKKNLGIKKFEESKMTPHECASQ